MSQVFNSAYCTISASSAKSSLDGFLTERKPRPCVQLQTNTGPLYICPAIDDFHHDVELSEINKRGWVLQERALSRRSIYFTSTQVYWECGRGIHCETLGRLHNSKAAFLGDAAFPKSALEYYRDGRQLLIQDLYERYSGLAFTMPSDRAVAILGLQERLAEAFQTQAAYGFFKVYFTRGLLWQRGQPRGMPQIAYPEGRRVPSWSWFSREGAIEYMKLKFKKIDWMRDLENPFTHQRGADPDKNEGLKNVGCTSVLTGKARKINMAQNEVAERIVFDDDGAYEVAQLRCVAIGRDKLTSGLKDAMIYALVIRQIGNSLEKQRYERVGVAYLRQEHMKDKGSWVDIM
ncbi:hypothetical protein CEP51_015807 [Fusarium floridanum]|uniref:Heterokaryon incompatibility domain-containing protein n=1 Tax=Fusarium floridanum TaxID=1325733 RepID=A0A428P2I2_9HYPO|nr:hypothetical protein CEP51_015807 [Fusarium floridanum]